MITNTILTLLLNCVLDSCHSFEKDRGRNSHSGQNTLKTLQGKHKNRSYMVTSVLKPSCPGRGGGGKGMPVHHKLIPSVSSSLLDTSPVPIYTPG